MLTTVNISRKNLKDVLNNILKDLNANTGDFQTNIEQKIDKKELQNQKIYWQNWFRRKVIHWK